MGSETAPVQRVKHTRGWEFRSPNFELMYCLSSPDFFLKAVDRIVSSHYNRCKNTQMINYSLFQMEYVYVIFCQRDLSQMVR